MEGVDFSVRPKVAIIQFPGVNCEYETLRACEAAGLDGWILRWNASLDTLRNAAAVILPGGFSYQDRIRAGVVAAKDRIVDEVAAAADRGIPVLGICNGAQILIEAGIAPGFEPGRVELALAPNQMPDRTGYYCTWIRVRRAPAPCLFTAFMTPSLDKSQSTEGLQPENHAGTLPLPIAHAEGRFLTASPEIEAKLRAGERIALLYATETGEIAERFPDNPNGSMFGIAGMTNAAGNVLALMPHPERASWMHQVPRHVGGYWGRRRMAVDGISLYAPGPGRGFFESLRKALD